MMFPFKWCGIAFSFNHIWIHCRRNDAIDFSTFRFVLPTHSFAHSRSLSPSLRLSQSLSLSVCMYFDGEKFSIAWFLLVSFLFCQNSLFLAIGFPLCQFACCVFLLTHSPQLCASAIYILHLDNRQVNANIRVMK